MKNNGKNKKKWKFGENEKRKKMKKEKKWKFGEDEKMLFSLPPTPKRCVKYKLDFSFCFNWNSTIVKIAKEKYE